ncbi:hypothetical protein [Candidatus Poriferisodalis sp.]|uniref:hypothetical protein n=1 Tax=Candidatus Poriferisodalis sp. TaxID=3101277 RepID=UPI003B02BC90
MAKQWREIYNEWESAVAPSLQQFAASDGFRDFMAASAKVTSAFAAEFEQASRRWLHFWNLPAATDVRKLRQQVAAVDRELKGLKNLVFDVVAVVPAEAAPATNGKAAPASKQTVSEPAASKSAATKASASKTDSTKASASKTNPMKPAAGKLTAAVESS